MLLATVVVVSMSGHCLCAVSGQIISKKTSLWLCLMEKQLFIKHFLFFFITTFFKICIIFLENSRIIHPQFDDGTSIVASSVVCVVEAAVVECKCLSQSPGLSFRYFFLPWIYCDRWFNAQSLAQALCLHLFPFILTPAASAPGFNPTSFSPILIGGFY